MLRCTGWSRLKGVPFKNAQSHLKSIRFNSTSSGTALADANQIVGDIQSLNPKRKPKTSRPHRHQRRAALQRPRSTEELNFKKFELVKGPKLVAESSIDAQANLISLPAAADVSIKWFNVLFKDETKEGIAGWSENKNKEKIVKLDAQCNEKLVLVLNAFLEYSTIEKVSKMAPTFETSFIGHIKNFGNINRQHIKNDLSNDEFINASISLAFTFINLPIMQAVAERKKKIKGKDQGFLFGNKFKTILESLAQLRAVRHYPNGAFDFCKLESSKSMERVVSGGFRKIWDEVKKPKFKNLSIENQQLLIDQLPHLVESIDANFFQEYLDELNVVNFNATNWELNCYLKSMISQKSINRQELYRLVRELFEAHSLKFDHETWGILLGASLKNKELRLFEQILADFNMAGGLPDRKILFHLQAYAVEKDSIGMWLKLMEMRILNFKYAFNSVELAQILSGLCRLNARSVALDLFNIILRIRATFQVQFEEELKLIENKQLLVKMEDENKQLKEHQNIGLDKLYQLFDLVNTKQELVENYPVLSGELFAPILSTSPNWQRFLHYREYMLVNNVAESVSSLIASLEMFSTWQEDRTIEEFQGIFKYAFETMPRYILIDIIENFQFMDILVRVILKLVDAGKIPNSKENRESYQLLMKLLELNDNITEVDQQVRGNAIAALMQLSGLKFVL